MPSGRRLTSGRRPTILSRPTHSSDIGDSPDFYLTSEAIVFYFQEYEYFPYAAGIQEFPLDL